MIGSQDPGAPLGGPGPPGVVGRLVALLLVAAGGGCTSLGDVHLAPVYTRIAGAKGTVETEWLAGLYRRSYRREEDGAAGDVQRTTVGPLSSYDRLGEDAWRRKWLVPFGFGEGDAKGATSVTIPFYWWKGETKVDGSKQWSLVSLPGLLMRRNSVEGTDFGWFPIGGALHDFFTYERIVFFLFPLFSYAERDDRVSYHFLYPILGWTRGGGERSQHLWPLYGRASIEGRYDRTYFLWPIFHVNRNHLGGGEEVPETTWMVLPLFGRSTRGTYESTTWLWPFFGWASNPKTGFWALDFPWFLVRLQHGPDDVRRTRFWPLFSHLEADRLTSRSYLWPLFYHRKEDYVGVTRETYYSIPLWQSWDRRETATGRVSKWRKLWPLYRWYRDEDHRQGSFLDLDPLQRGEMIDRHYGWLWKIYEWEESDELRRERSWAGLWRRERDTGEDRASFMGLWSRRKYDDEEGRRVKETSLLFGLIRWRTVEGEGSDLLPISVPGPGWPAVRVEGPPLAGGEEEE